MRCTERPPVESSHPKDLLHPLFPTVSSRAVVVGSLEPLKAKRHRGVGWLLDPDSCKLLEDIGPVCGRSDPIRFVFIAFFCRIAASRRNIHHRDHFHREEVNGTVRV